MMVTGQTQENFMASLNNLVGIFPAPAFTQVKRLAQSVAALAIEKMQIPAKTAAALPASIPLSVPTSRAALSAAAINQAQKVAGAGFDIEGLKKQLGEFTQLRDQLISDVASGLNDLQGKSARAWVFTASGDTGTTLLELVKDIPQQSAVYTAAMMLVGDNLDGIPVPMAGNDSGMFQFPPEGTLVEVAFTGGRPDKPFIRQTLPDGTSLPDVKPGEQLQQQREEVSQRVTLAGDWVRQTDQTISETSMVRTVKADTEQRDLVSRETTVKATDKTIVVGTATLLAGAIQQVSAGDFSQAVKGNRLASIEGNEETDIAGQQSIKVGGAVAVEVGESLTEKIAALRKSVAAGGQQVMGATVHIGSENINALTMMLDTIDLLAELAQQCANHSHPTVGTPTNAAAFTQTATKAGQTRSKYQNIIA